MLKDMQNVNRMQRQIVVVVGRGGRWGWVLGLRGEGLQLNLFDAEQVRWNMTRF